MNSFHKRLCKRKRSKLSLKRHRKHKNSTAEETSLEEATGSFPVRPEEIKMHP